MTHRRRRVLRFGVAIAAVALIAALPSLAGARPQPADRTVSASTLLARVRASSTTGYSGYAQTAGSASIPDVADLGDIPSLLGDVTMLRVWWSGPQQWRVDTVSATNEEDTYAPPRGHLGVEQRRPHRRRRRHPAGAPHPRLRPHARPARPHLRGAGCGARGHRATRDGARSGWPAVPPSGSR